MSKRHVANYDECLDRWSSSVEQSLGFHEIPDPRGEVSTAAQ